jgi:hypothetical protein
LVERLSNDFIHPPRSDEAGVLHARSGTGASATNAVVNPHEEYTRGQRVPIDSAC